MQINFDEYRRTDGTLELFDMFRDNPPNDKLTKDQLECAKVYLKSIEGVYKITSRQAAAVAMASAGMFVLVMFPRWPGR